MPADPVEAAIAARVSAASPSDLVVLADRMASLAHELEARRLARTSNVVDLGSRKRLRSTR